MGSKVQMPAAPPPPAQVDPAQSSLNYIRAMADPNLQAQILAAEQQFRPEYTQLELADINTILQGGGGQRGLLDIQDEATRRQNDIMMQALSQQRSADIGDVERLGGRATAAFRAADPLQQAIVNNLNAMASEAQGRRGTLTPEQMRNATQQARLAGLARGRIGDQSTIASEVLNREASLAQRRAEAQQANMAAFGVNQATAADPFQAILGRPAQAPGAGMAATQFASQLAGQQLGPNLFDPNAGINLALQQNANMANYQSNIYGAQAGYAGATNQGRGAMIGGVLSGLGALGGGALIACWVAREVFGNDNPMWLLFRQWLFEDSPKWFYNLYIKRGEKFAAYIADKPVLKGIIRKWMTARIRNKFANHPSFI